MPKLISSRLLRRTVPLLAVLFLVGLSSGAQAASAASGEASRESVKRFQTSLGFGAMWLGDETIESVYGSQARFMPKLSAGFVPLSKYVHLELNFSLSFLQFSGSETFVSTGGASADEVWMTIFPMGVDLLVGIDIADEQPVVPFGGVGFAAALWREHQSGGGDSWTGDRFGWSGFFGLAILMDRFEPARSRKLDVASGINDVFFALEGRYSDVSNQIRDGELTQEGLHFGGWAFTGSLKFVH